MLRTSLKRVLSLAALALLLVCGLARAADNDILAHYTFSEAEKEADRKNPGVYDHSPNKNHGTCYGAAYVKDGDGYALALQETGFAKCNPRNKAYLGAKPFTIDLWLKLDAYGSGMVLAKKGSKPEDAGWHLSYDQPTKRLVFNLSDGASQGAVGAPLADMNWHHAAIVRNGAELSLFLDGKQVAGETDKAFAVNVDNAGSFFFLGRAIGPYRAIRGKIDEVTVRSRALTAAEVAARYAAMKPAMPAPASGPAESPLVLHYAFDEDLAAVVKDLSPFGNDGEIVKAQYLAEVQGRRGVVRFDGDESVINCPNTESLNFGGDMSFEMWVRKRDYPKATWATLFGEKGDFAFYIVYQRSLVLWTTTYNNELRAWESVMQPAPRSAIGEDWSHVAVVVEYPRCRFYCNGKLVRDGYMPVPAIANRNRLVKQIGLKAPIDLDEFRLYRRALTPEEVAAHAKGQPAPSEPSLELAVDTHWYNETVTLRLNCKNADYAGYRAELSLQGGDAADVAKPQSVAIARVQDGPARYVGQAVFPLKPLVGRSVQAVARLTDGQGQPVQTLTVPASLTKPEWVNSKEGYYDGVLPPWTPVETAATPGGAEVRVWGRRHVFESAPFPREIESQGQAILAAPISLSGQSNGKPIAWSKANVKVVGHSDTRATIESRQSGNGVNLSVNASIEYDGYMIFDCAVTAKEDMSLDALTFEIPLQTRYAGLCHGDRVLPPKPGIAIGEWYSGAVRGDLAFRFSSNIWLGDGRQGLIWQAESDEDWRYADPNKAIEILPRGETTTFRAHWVNVPTKLAAGRTLRYKFALEATPIKPVLRDAWQLRILRSEPYGADLDLPDRTVNGKPVLRILADAGVRRLFTNVNDDWPYPMPRHGQFARALRRMVDAAHAEGIQVHNYLIHQRYPVMTPEFDPHGRHMAKWPVNQYMPGSNPPGARRPGTVSYKHGADSQGTVYMCAKSRALQDSYIHALAKRLDTFGDDGVYLDGTNAIVPCYNTDHGCGYRAADGAIHPTRPVFAVREFLRRIYTVVKTRRPDGVVDEHCSFGQNMAALAYTDNLWTGEQWHHLRKTGAKHVASQLTFDKFRTEFTGLQSGVAADTLAYRLGSNIKVAATSLLHDVPVRASNYDPDPTPRQPKPGMKDYTNRLLKLWKVREAFGAEEDVTRKLFYYANQDYVTVSPSGCYSTLLHHPENGVLAVVSNLSEEAKTIKVRFDLNRLNLAGRKITASDALYDTPLTMAANGEVSLKLKSEDWTYILLSPHGNR